nr:cyclic nucleotide-gated ion channel 1-like [Quercus suber]
MSNRGSPQENGESMNRETEIEDSGNVNGLKGRTKRIILGHVWNYLFLFSCVIAAIVDPLFFYIPVISDSKRCLLLEKKLWIAVFAFRMVTDVIYLVHIALRSWMVFKICVKNRSNICCSNTKVSASVRRCFSFLIDVFVVLPIPQVVFPFIFKEMRSTRPSEIIKSLNTLVLFQYVPRIRQIYLSWKNLPRNAGKLDGWIKALFNFFLFILASHVIGAFWYFFSIQRETACWHLVCGNLSGCGNSFSCAYTDSAVNYAFLDDHCPINTPNTTKFDFGIFLEALQSGIVQSSNLPQKFFYCFWWGLRNLSSFGQGLQTSSYLWESCFSIFISILGLMLFLYFLENLKVNTQFFLLSFSYLKRLEIVVVLGWGC